MSSPLLDVPDGDPPERDAAQAAFLESIFRAHYRDLYAMVYRYLRSPAVAEEVVQDSFLTLWDRRDRWAGAADLRGYLFTVARNRAISLLRRERIETAWQERAGRGDTASGIGQYSATVGEEPEVDELVERLHRAIEALPERARCTLLLRLRRQLRNAEVAEVMGITEKAVERNFTRAVEALRKALGADGDAAQ